MNNNPNQPRIYDAVFGGQSPPPSQGVVLGGIEGVLSRLASPVVEARVAAVSEALNYGDAGLELVIQALNDESRQVQRTAFVLLRERVEPQTKQALQALLEYDSWVFFTTLANWTVENFDPQIGITDPVGTAYALEFDRLKILLQNPRSSKIEALVCQMWQWRYHYSFSLLVDFLLAAHEQLSSLKALFIGDIEEYVYRSSSLKLSGDISYVLVAYPNLEVLQVRGRSDDLEFSPLRHDKLKSLIVETGALSRETIAQICALELPRLEYLELWLGSCGFYGTGYSSIYDLMPILSGNLFPKLSYLGLCSSDYSDYIAYEVVRSPIIDRLMVLNLSMGTLTDEGAEALLNCPAINRLHTLNVAMNLLSTNMTLRLSQLNCRVIAQPQANEQYRYHELHE